MKRQSGPKQREGRRRQQALGPLLGANDDSAIHSEGGSRIGVQGAVDGSSGAVWPGADKASPSRQSAVLGCGRINTGV
ncbi:hypothetical protein BM1_01525 [Bipolaris maydis]|nr:hypothetical protein BM1_01525 [Bipolaris maydis]